MNYTEIFDEVKGELNRDDLDDFISSWVNRAYRDVMGREPFTWLNATAQRNTVDNVYRYELPSDFYDATEVLLLNGTESIPLNQLLIDEFDRNHPYPPSDSKDSPVDCAIHHGKEDGTYNPYNELVLWPVPDGEYVISLRYEITAPDLSGTLVPVLPPKYHQVIVFGALQHAFARLREYDAAMYWRNEKEAMISVMIREDREMPNVARALRPWRPAEVYSGNAHLNPFIRRMI